MSTNPQRIDRRDLAGRPSPEPGSDDATEVVALGYASARGSAENLDLALRLQADTITRFCARRGWTLVELVREGRPPSGRAFNRPSLDYVLDCLRGGAANCLVVTELSHLSSSVADLSEVLDALDDADARLITLEPAVDSGSLLGRASLRVVRSVSRWERRRRTEMTSAARAKVTALSLIDPKLKRRIQRMRSAGMTLQGIADLLNDEHVPTTRGGAEWRPSSVQAALGYRRPRS